MLIRMLEAKQNVRSDAGQWCHYCQLDLIELKLKRSTRKSESNYEENMKNCNFASISKQNGAMSTIKS